MRLQQLHTVLGQKIKQANVLLYEKKILTVIIISALLFACSKQNTALPSNGLTGDSWKNIGYGGGFAGLKFTPVSDTVKNYIEFDTAQVLFYSNGSQGCFPYTFVQDTGAIFRGLLNFPDSGFSPLPYDIALINDTLTLYPHGVADGFTNYYVRSLKTFSWDSCEAVIH